MEGNVLKFIVHTDGGCPSNPGPGAWGVVIQSDDSIEEHSGFLPQATCNIAEYRGLEAACLIITRKEVLPDVVEIFSDSQLVVNQINGVYRVNEPILPYYQSAHAAYTALKNLCPVTLSWVRREFNQDADRLCNMVLDKYGVVCKKKGKKRDE